MDKMTEKEFEKFAEIFQALSNKTRLQIVSGVMKDECSVSVMIEKLKLPQSTISQHLRVLRNLKIIKGRKEGSKRCYKVIDKRVRDIVEFIEQM